MHWSRRTGTAGLEQGGRRRKGFARRDNDEAVGGHRAVEDQARCISSKNFTMMEGSDHGTLRSNEVTSGGGLERARGREGERGEEEGKKAKMVVMMKGAGELGT